MVKKNSIMKKNKKYKHKYNTRRKGKKTINQHKHHKTFKYSRKFRGGAVCLKEITNKTLPVINRIDDGSDLPKASTGWGFGLFGKKTPAVSPPVGISKNVSETPQFPPLPPNFRPPPPPSQ
jgi:hypothetical protein